MDYNVEFNEMDDQFDVHFDNAQYIKGDKGEPGANGLTPFINDAGNWQIGDTDTGVKAEGTNGSDGFNGVDGLTPYINDNGSWQIGEDDTGIKAAGVNGTNGDSAYDIAKKNGFDGTEEEWLVSLKGEQGQQGIRGVQGDKGDPGYTPQKGIDYWTENDKEEVKSYIRTELEDADLQGSTKIQLITWEADD